MKTKIMKNPDLEDMASSSGLSEATSVLSLMSHDDRLRVLCNLSTEAVHETLHFDKAVLEACHVDLLESPMTDDCLEPSVTHGGSRIRIPLDPHRIATMAVAFAQEETS